MGNQLAATPTVDLANVSTDLELIAPLGAEGRNYFATFHCLSYTSLPLSTSARSTASGYLSTAQEKCQPSSDNDPHYSTGFCAVDGSGRRAGYRPNSLHYPSSASVGSPLTASPLSKGAPRGRGRGGGGGGWGGLSSFPAAATPTTYIAASERAAWHQARWRQRLPVAARPWRVTPAHFVSEASQERCPAGEVMDRWCRDSAAASLPFSHSSGGRLDAYVSDGVTSPQPLLSSSSSPSLTARATTMSHTDIDMTVAGVVGEWRGNYGNYVQLLLRGGGSASQTVSSAALCDGQVIHLTTDPARGAATTSTFGVAGYGARSAFSAAMSAASPASQGGSVAAPSLRQSYLMHDVVTKVFVRTPDDPGQTYFLKRVQEMMGNAGEQLAVVDSTLAPTTPRNCLWYSSIYEGDGFCVLQRPYVAFTLRERLTARPCLTEVDKLFMAFQLLQALAHLHETYGLTHGDIKPNNVLVQSTGVVVLCDMAPFKPWRLPLDSPLLFDYYYDTDESRACYVAPEKFSDQPLPVPPLESRTRGNATYNVGNVNFDGHTAAMDVFSAACVILFLYGEEDPFTLSEVLSLRHRTTTEEREKAITPVLHDCDVPAALHPLLLWMLCSPSTERPSAREVLNRGLAERVFPPCFAFLYLDVWPRLLTEPPDVRLRLFQNQMPTILQRCGELDSLASEEAEEILQRERETISISSGVQQQPGSSSCAIAVGVLLPLLLQTIHSASTSDDAAFRGVRCLRQCVSHCSFDSLTDFVLPHLVFLVNNDAHVCGTATRLLALRLLCTVAETIARHLTAPEATPTTEPVPDEEQWALMEHLVLPCLYDVLRQGEEEATAVLVELAERLPRLLLLTRFLTERRQVLYGAEDGASATTHLSEEEVRASTTAAAAVAALSAATVGRRVAGNNATGGVASPASKPLSDNKARDENIRDETTAAQSTRLATPPPYCSNAVAREDSAYASLSEGLGPNQLMAIELPEAKGDDSAPPSIGAVGVGQQEPMSAKESTKVPGSSTAGAAQYLAQTRSLLTNGWNMLQVLYSHPCVVVAAAMMRQTTSTVASFLGEARVAEDLIPLLTTALTAPLRVVRLLFPQAILLHALLQNPQAKTLRLFVEEGLRHPDDVCLKSTLDSIAVVVRSRRLSLEDSMALVHQILPFLMDGRLWLREAACGVVEAAAQSYPPSVIALHLEYAVRPLLIHPVPLSQLRRFAASIIRSELATTGLPVSRLSASHRYGSGNGVMTEEVSGRGVEWSLLNDEVAEAAAPHDFLGVRGRVGLPHLLGHESNSEASDNASWHVDYRDALPAVVSATTHSTSSFGAPALLHTLPRTARLSAAPSLEKEEAQPGAHDLSALTYQLSLREAARLVREEKCNWAMDPTSTPSAPPASVSSAVSAAVAAGVSRVGAVTPLAPQSHEGAVAPPHPIELHSLPTTLAPHSSLCRCGAPLAVGRGNDGDGGIPSFSFAARQAVPPSAISALNASAATVPANGSSAQLPLRAGSPTAAAPSSFSLVSASPLARSSALRPVAAPLSSASAHMGAIYTAVAAPAANGVVVTAGTRGEAFVWRVESTQSQVMPTRDLTLVDRVAPGVSAHASAGFSYVASQWMDVSPQRGDSVSSALPASANTVALASTDGMLRLLDVERNAWVWSTAVGGGADGTPTGLALHDRRSLLVTTAAGGLHVVDTRCRGSAGDETGKAAGAGQGLRVPFASAWSSKLHPLDGAPSCLVPLYAGERACAAAVATYGGVVCLYDLRYQLCAQRTTVVASQRDRLASSLACITSACVDPLSSLSGGCRVASWEPSVPGPSLLLATTAGTVYRLLLQSDLTGAYWPAFQSPGGIRCVLAQPSNGSVFTGSDDGYIRHWNTDRPETSHTMDSVTFPAPSYTVTRNALVATADGNGGGGAAAGVRCGTRRLATLTVHEGVGVQRVLPHHAPDAVLTLCAVQTAASSASWSGAGDSHSFLLSGARDGSLTLWNNVE